MQLKSYFWKCFIAKSKEAVTLEIATLLMIQNPHIFKICFLKIVGQIFKTIQDQQIKSINPSFRDTVKVPSSNYVHLVGLKNIKMKHSALDTETV